MTKFRNLNYEIHMLNYHLLSTSFKNLILAAFLNLQFSELFYFEATFLEICNLENFHFFNGFYQLPVKRAIN